MRTSTPSLVLRLINLNSPTINAHQIRGHFWRGLKIYDLVSRIFLNDHAFPRGKVTAKRDG